MGPLVLVALAGGVYYLYEKQKNPQWSPFSAVLSTPGQKAAALTEVKIASIPTPAVAGLDPGMTADQVKQTNEMLLGETDPNKVYALASALGQAGYMKSSEALIVKAEALGKAKANGAGDDEIFKSQLEAGSAGTVTTQGGFAVGQWGGDYYDDGSGYGYQQPVYQQYQQYQQPVYQQQVYQPYAQSYAPQAYNPYAPQAYNPYNPYGATQVYSPYQAACPFGTTPSGFGTCVPTAIPRNCPLGTTWNGVRCVRSAYVNPYGGANLHSWRNLITGQVDVTPVGSSVDLMRMNEPGQYMLVSGGYKAGQSMIEVPALSTTTFDPWDDVSVDPAVVVEDIGWGGWGGSGWGGGGGWGGGWGRGGGFGGFGGGRGGGWGGGGRGGGGHVR